MKKLIFLFFLGCILTSYAHPSDFQHFREVSPAEGFTYSAVQTIAEDKLGFIWFGTQHGLYKYNTVEIAKYFHEMEDNGSIPGNNIRNLYCDKTGKMWIATASGLCYYDDKYERFVRCSYADSTGKYAGTNIFQVFEDQMEQLWLIDDFGLAKVDTALKKITYLSAGPGNGTVRVAKIARNGIIWLGTTNGTILRVLPPYQKMEVFGKFRQAMVQALWPSDQVLWVGYEWNGVDKIDYGSNLLAHYNMEGRSDQIICHSRVRDIFESEDKKMWIATFKGISIIEGENIRNYYAEDLNGISYSSIYKFYQDSHNGFWVGTWSGGLFYRNPNDNDILHIKTRVYKSQDYNVISSFTEDLDGQVWVGSESGILYTYDANFNEIGQYRLQQGNLNITNIKSLHTDSKGNIWMGTFAGGLWVKPPGNSQFKRLPLLEQLRASIYDFAEESDGMWIGTFNNGLYFYNLETGFTENFRNIPNDTLSLSNSMIRCLLSDGKGNLWVGTAFGLNQYSRKSRTFKRIFSGLSDQQISDNEVFSMLRDSQGYLWVGTGNGLNLFDHSTGTFKKYFASDGLAGNEIYGLAEDDEGKLWISTENGISCFNPRNNTFRNFGIKDGLQGKQFNPGAAFKCKNNNILFGGSNGFNVIQPILVKSNPLPPKAILTSLIINNQEVRIRQKHSPLERSLQTTQKISLKAWQNSLSFTFVATNYLLPEKNRFRYRLLNYNDEWMEAGSERKATFTKIPPGNYTFQVLASNNDEVWSQEPTSLEVTILHPFWLRWYAFVLYAAALILLAYILDREVNFRRFLRLEIVRERMGREQEEQLAQAKLRFFINISHEFRTPLTLILTPLTQLYNKFGKEPGADFLFDIVRRNAVRMQNLINEVIDMRKLDLGLIKPVLSSFDLVTLCREEIECFALAAKDHDIRLRLDTEFSELQVYSDEEKMDKIIFNLISNAVKFTKQGGYVTVMIRRSEEVNDDGFKYVTPEKIIGPIIEVVVKDDGITIPEEQIVNMFDLFVQGDHPGKSGTGIGLHLVREYTKIIGGNLAVRSDPGLGTMIALRIPVVQDLPYIMEDMQYNHNFPEILSKNTYTEDIEPEKGQNLPMILVVDDNSEMRNFLEYIFSKQYRIITAGNGKLGYEKAMVAQPDLIISDVQMPVADGFELNRLLKSNSLTQSIPIIFLTGYPLPNLQTDSLEAGVDACIIKPFSEELLIAQVKNLIEAKRRILSGIVTSVKTPESEEPASMEQFFMDKVIKTIEKNMYNPFFGVETLADELNMSRTSLYRKLKLVTGQSATEFVRSVRLKAALAYLEKGKLSIEEAGNAVGFNSPSYFSHCFRQQYGKTPSEYLKDLRKGPSEG